MSLAGGLIESGSSGVAPSLSGAFWLAGSPEAPDGAPAFADVPDTHLFYDEITWLVGVGITVGYDDETFRPAVDVSREGVAAFLFRYSALAEAV